MSEVEETEFFAEEVEYFKTRLGELESALDVLASVIEKSREARANKQKSLVEYGKTPKAIPGFEDYSIDASGVIRSLATGEAIKTPVSNAGYRVCCLYKRTTKGYLKSHTFTVARLLCAAFKGLDLTDRKCSVDHLDFNRSNDDLSNLEVVSMKENLRRARERYSDGYVDPKIYTSTMAL